MTRALLKITAALAILLATDLAPGIAADQLAVPLVESYLVKGDLAVGDMTLAKRIQEQPHDDQARFGLGVLRFARAVEHLAQSLYRYGLRDLGPGVGVPLLRLPLPTNRQPAKLSYDGSRQVLQNFLDDLAKAEATLVDIQGDVKLPLHFARIRLDLDGDGQADATETLWSLYVRMNRNAGTVQPNADDFLITFDTADVFWLRGYCHLLSALCETALAHDGRNLFEHTAHLFFTDVETPYTFLQAADRQDFPGQIVDYITLIHLINLPVVEPKRMASALGHLEQVVAHSRSSWQALLAETDDDHEWIPNPRQTGVIPGVAITQPMVDGWQEFLSEAESILAGKKLIPFWRHPGKRGVNLRHVFTEPRTFDLVLWVQGTGAAPYLEEGELSTPAVWQRFNRLFGGEFIGFALWFN